MAAWVRCLVRHLFIFDLAKDKEWASWSLQVGGKQDIDQYNANRHHDLVCK